jgi:hypothetical protein
MVRSGVVCGVSESIRDVSKIVREKPCRSGPPRSERADVLSISDVTRHLKRDMIRDMVNTVFKAMSHRIGGWSLQILQTQAS